MDMRSSSRLAAEWALELYKNPIPEDVEMQARLLMLDCVGCMLAAIKCSAGVEAIYSTAGVHNGSATIMGQRAYSTADAAFANASLAHGLDYDDTHGPSLCHTSAVVLPSVLAVAESQDQDCDHLLRSFIAGTEVIARIGTSGRGKFHQRGFHPTSVCGVFGSALSASLLAEADVETIVNACGVAGSFAGGIFAYLGDDSNPKPYHAGHASWGGVRAYQLASYGATGPAHVLEGKFGMMSAFAGMDGEDLLDAMSTLGKRWELSSVHIKKYPSCHQMHAILEAVSSLQEQEDISWQDVSVITAYVPHQTAVDLVLEPIGQKRRPGSSAAAKFSLPYSIGAMIVNRVVNLETYEPSSIVDERIHVIADLVEYEIKEYEAGEGAMPGGVCIKLSDGRVLDSYDSGYGCVVSTTEISEVIRKKFEENANGVLSSKGIRDFVQVVQEMDRNHRARELTNIINCGMARTVG